MRHRPFAGLALATLALLLCVRAQAGECDGSSQALATMAAARAKLLALPVTGEYPDPTLPEDAQRNIERLKDGVADLVGARMRCAASAADAHGIEQDLKRALQGLAVPCDGECKKRVAGGEDPYRDIPDLKAQAWPQHRLAIVAHIPIVCGSDAMLFVFERDGTTWRSRMRWRSPPYKDVSGAFESFDYKVAPPDEHGGWYVLAKSIKPWCSSTWSSIRYAVLRPSADAAKIVYQAEDSIWWGGDDFGTIVAKPHAFDVRFHAGSIDTGVHNRVWIRHFTIDGDNVRRVQPVALTPRDFVDEWIQSGWAQAAAWSSPNDTTLANWHERLRGKDAPFHDFQSVRACSGTAHGFEVAVADPDTDTRYYLRVEGGGGFTLTGVATKADVRCRGKDLLGTMQTR